MRRVLIVSPHYPPSSLAGVHRARLLARRLPEFGWEPTVLAGHPDDYEEANDPELERMSAGVRVVRYRMLHHRWTRPFGLGDISIRGGPGCLRKAWALLAREPFDLLFITVAPYYTALLGPILKRRFGLPFVLDYQDPWVSRWGAEQPRRSKAGLHHKAAEVLEPKVLRRVDLLTAVSEGTYAEILARNPWFPRERCAAFPIGGDAQDFDYLHDHPRPSPPVETARRRGAPVVACVGTFPPRGRETAQALFDALRSLAGQRSSTEVPSLLFVGTTGLPEGPSDPIVLPLARRAGVEPFVFEHPGRIPYADALNVLWHADWLLLLGSDEAHYTASRLYPYLLARRPILAAFHAESSVVSVARRATAEHMRLIVYDERAPARTKVEELTRALAEVKVGPRLPAPEDSAFRPYSASGIARGYAERFSSLLRSQGT
ncbi:MAG: hypothetical protein D6731_01525 [Planctomycetota bacterium]|nr:MAG: hypothetical protein D6731_01525 [Planctomycetota bacterium]